MDCSDAIDLLVFLDYLVALNVNKVHLRHPVKHPL